MTNVGELLSGQSIPPSLYPASYTVHTRTTNQSIPNTTRTTVAWTAGSSFSLSLTNEICIATFTVRWAAVSSGWRYINIYNIVSSETLARDQRLGNDESEQTVTAFIANVGEFALAVNLRCEVEQSTGSSLNLLGGTNASSFTILRVPV